MHVKTNKNICKITVNFKMNKIKKLWLFCGIKFSLKMNVWNN